MQSCGQEVLQRQMVNPHAATDGFAGERGARVPARTAVAGVQADPVDQAFGDRADEAGMHPDVDEAAARSEHAHCLPHEAAEVIDIGVSEHGHRQLDDAVAERQGPGSRTASEHGSGPRFVRRRTALFEGWLAWSCVQQRARRLPAP